MDRDRRFREAVVVSQEPFRPNVRLICQVLTEMGVAMALASSVPTAADACEGAGEPSGGHVRGGDTLLAALGGSPPPRARARARAVELPRRGALRESGGGRGVFAPAAGAASTIAACGFSIYPTCI